MHKALTKIGIKVNLVGMSEIDVDAIKSYNAIHYGEIEQNIELSSEEEMRNYLVERNIGFDFKKNRTTIGKWKGQKLIDLYKICVKLNNYGDISKINLNELPDFDLFNFSFPCTDISVAGQQQGMKDEKGGLTRSGMYIYGMNIIKTKKPKYIMIENVKNLVGKKFKADFDEIVKDLQDNNYNVYWKILNAKDFGIPQNRERVFAICVRKDIDNKSFEFPKGFDNGIRLKDVLEDQVDEKYYVAKEKTEKLLGQLKDKDSLLLDMCQSKREGKPREYTDFAPTLSARDYKEPRLINRQITGVYNQNDGFKEREIGCTLDASYYKGLGNNQNRNAVLVVDDLYSNRDVRVSESVPTLRADRQGLKVMKLEDILDSDAKPPILHNIYGGFKEKEPRIFNDYSPTIRTAAGGGHIPSVCTTDDNKVEKIVSGYKIRKLTPCECYRLMGFDDEDFYKAKNSGVSDTQLYRQAGNSIVVNVLEAIFKNLFYNTNTI